jgi:hypothetical protein
MSRIRSEIFEAGVQKAIPEGGMAADQRLEHAMIPSFKPRLPVSLEAREQRDETDLSAGKPRPEEDGTGNAFEQDEGKRIQEDRAAEKGAGSRRAGSMLVPQEPEAATGAQMTQRTPGNVRDDHRDAVAGAEPA